MYRGVAIFFLAAALPLSTSAACITLTRTLSFGSTGSDVTALQTFFNQTYQEFSSSSITGYFGPLTQAALQQWQAEQGIVSSGSPATTGWGVVGPKTRAALACTGSAASSSSPTPAPTSEGTTQVSQPISSSDSDILGIGASSYYAAPAPDPTTPIPSPQQSQSPPTPVTYAIPSASYSSSVGSDTDLTADQSQLDSIFNGLVNDSADAATAASDTDDGD